METGTHRDTGETWRRVYIETGTPGDEDIVIETGTHRDTGETWRQEHIETQERHGDEYT